jgi:hypothetical protein
MKSPATTARRDRDATAQRNTTRAANAPNPAPETLLISPAEIPAATANIAQIIGLLPKVIFSPSQYTFVSKGDHEPPRH